MALCRGCEGSDRTMHQTESFHHHQFSPWTCRFYKGATSGSVGQRNRQSLLGLSSSVAAASPSLRLSSSLGCLDRSDEPATVSSSLRNNPFGTDIATTTTTTAAAAADDSSSVVVCQCHSSGHCCSRCGSSCSALSVLQLSTTATSSAVDWPTPAPLLHLICNNHHGHNNNNNNANNNNNVDIIDYHHQPECNDDANNILSFHKHRHSSIQLPPDTRPHHLHHQTNQNNIRCHLQIQSPQQLSIKSSKMSTTSTLVARPNTFEMINDTRQQLLLGSISLQNNLTTVSHHHLPNKPSCRQLVSSNNHKSGNGVMNRLSTILTSSTTPSAQCEDLDCNSLEYCSVTYLSSHSLPLSPANINPNNNNNNRTIINSALKSASDRHSFVLSPIPSQQSSQSVNKSLNSNLILVSGQTVETDVVGSKNLVAKQPFGSRRKHLWKYSHHNPMILMLISMLLLSGLSFSLLHLLNASLYLYYLSTILLLAIPFILLWGWQQQSCYFNVQIIFFTSGNLAKVSSFLLPSFQLFSSYLISSVCNLLFYSQCQLFSLYYYFGCLAYLAGHHCTTTTALSTSTISHIISNSLSLLQSTTLYLITKINAITQFMFETRTKSNLPIYQSKLCRIDVNSSSSSYFHHRCPSNSQLSARRCNRQSYFYSHLSTLVCVALFASSLVSCSVPVSSIHSADSIAGSADSNQRVRRTLRPVGLRSSHGLSKSNYTYFEEADTDIYFSHMAFNFYTGHIYIGAVNGIYQLNSQLTLEAKATLGPQEDSVECPATKSCPNVNKKLSNYYNKALVIDYAHSWLISCGSLYQGACMTHRLDNVTHFLNQPSESVVANNSTASTVAFIAPGPPPHKQVLYIGATYTQGNYRSDVPAVSSRSLIESSLFQFAAADVSTGTRLVVNSLVRDRYPISYIYGFHSRGFSYFLTVQKSNVEGQRPFISKLVRICHRDSDYYSYTEVPLVCRSSRGKYNLAQAAFVGKPGLELAKAMGITAQDDLLFVVFSRSREDLEDNHPTAQSALCIYSLQNVHRIFTQNIQHCFNGNGNQGLDFINILQKCVSTQVQINEDFCGMDVNQPLGGTLPIETEPSITFDNVLLTSVAATSTHDYTVVFLGTSTGHLKKVVVEASKHAEAHEFSDMVIQEGSPINQDMSVVAYDKYLYVMTRRRVTMVKVQECHIYRSCMDCLGAHNPYCGWCSLENKCSLRSACAEAASDPLYWLSYKSGKCTTITSVNPPQIQRTTTRTLNLVIDNLPSLDGLLLCVFTTQGKTQVTNATRSTNGVSCPTPSTDTLPQIPQGRHAFTSKLSVRMKGGPDFVATNFTFYHCASYTSCTTCVSSSFPCDWCVGGHRCTHDTGENCRNEILVTGLKSVGPSIRSGPSFCPRIINSTVGGSTEILVPNGARKRISVKVVNIPQSTISIRFVCQFNIEGRVKQVNAQLLSDTIYCEELVFSYVTNQTNITAAFAVIWDGNKPLDNPDNIHVLVYRCEGLASNCGFCLELEEKYNCGWCQKGGSCEVQDQCQHHNTMWLNRQQTCPNPQITDFYPKSGPYEGGTNLTIEGINLGRVYEDIENGIGISYEMNGKRVSLVPCIPYPEEYVKTSRIKCRIQSPRNFTSSSNPQHSYISGHVIVRVLTEYTAKSRDSYTFVNPKILTINPSKGPVSGGTLLSFEGLNLNAGSSAEAFLGNLPCNVTRRTINHAECITSGRGYPGEEQVRVKFDNGNRYFEYYKFLYVEDPKIFSVESGSGGSRGDPRGIPSGGISIVVKGENMNIIQKPQMYVELDSEFFASNCSTTSASDMKCESPLVPVDKLDFNWSDKEYIELDYGFLMDGVRTVRSLTTRSDKPFGKFRMYRNPDFQFFTEENGIKFYRGEYLTINGRYLEGIAQDTDVTVWVGSDICNVTSLSRIQLTCRLPSSRPPAEDENYERTYDLLPAVIVGVGRRLNITLGRLSYDASSASGSFFSFSSTSSGNLYKHVFIVIVIGICILFVVVVVILILYRRKSTESSRVLKTMQEQMDVLELRVASEAKEAFAELQTEITDITQEINVGGIPFLDYRLYTLKVLFPNADDHAVLRDLSIEPNERSHVERALQLFGQLIMNKTFLLLFIRTLESNRYFSMRDRVNVASLIMVTLQSKMEYCTSILKTLLAELIEKCIDGKSHPKLLLRRTESVAEKMLSSWFTFLLYKFLKECAGEPLYLLYFAIKHQVEKGPVDEITSEARYSLSEEKLIRQQIDYKQITVYVSIQSAYAPNLYGASIYEQSQLPFPQQAPPAAQQTVLYGQTQIYSSLPTSDFIEVQVKVLDCDTISQVKEKALDTIYRGVPFSARPFREDELDLEWRTGQSGKITLANEDTTSRVSGEWRRLNTLAHYKVPDNGSLMLVPNAKQQNLLYNTIDYMSIAGPDKMATLGGGSSSSSSGFAEKHRYEPLHHFIKSGGAIGGIVSNSPPSSLSRPTSPPTNNHYHHHHGEYDNGTYHQRSWHLVKHHDNDHGKESERGNKMVSEIYLTRLLATKGTLQKYVDDLFETIFSTAHRGSSLPLAIKYMFDFLDDQASHHAIHDSEVVHTWKSNSLPLRFWVNLIKNPNFVFDINKSNIVDSCLSVVAQTFMDACSTSDHRLGKDSPSSKLLYAKDIPIYKEWVERYYKEIETMPSISDHDMNAMLAEESRQHSHEFNTNVALHELYKYAYKYKDQLLQTLNDDEFAVKNNLPFKLERVYDTMAGDEPL